MTRRREAWSRRAIAVLAALVLALGGRAMAATYYVDAAGRNAGDANDGSSSAPWKTVQHAADSVGAGDVVIVRPGRYDEMVTVRASGTERALITLRAEPARAARVKGFVLEGDFVSIEGFEITSDATEANGIFAGEAHRETARTGCRMMGNFIHDIGGTGIVTGERALVKGNLIRNVFRGAFVNSGTLFEGNEIDTLVPRMAEKNGQMRPSKTQYTFFVGEDITFRGNYLHGAPEEYLKEGMGVCFFASWDAWIMGSSHRILIENNRCFNATHASEPTAEQHKQSSHITYRNNLFVNTVHVGVMPKRFKHVTVENNTFINCGAYPVWLQGKEQCETAVVRNNLIAYWNHYQPEKYGWHAAESGVRLDFQGEKDFCDYNLFFGCKNRGYGDHDFVAEPRFVDPDQGDFRLQPGSPGIDAGTTIEAVKADLRGVPRPQGQAYDVGAYELKPSASSQRRAVR